MNVVAQLGGDVLHFHMRALVEPQGAGAEGAALRVELREALALVGNGNGSDALGIDLAGHLLQGRGCGAGPVGDLLLEPAGLGIGQRNAGAAFGNDASVAVEGNGLRRRGG